MSDKQCPSFEGCKAPLCPIDKFFSLAIWFPGETVCNAHAFRSAPWRKAQIKIARKAIDRDNAYNLVMLNSIRRVKKVTVGLPPELIENPESLNSWLGRRLEYPSFNEIGHITPTDKDLAGVVDSQRHPE